MPLAFGPFLLDHARATLAREGVPVEAQPRVIAAIELLARSGGRILSREELLAALWPDVVVSDDALHQLLRKVRRALGDDPAAPTYLEAVSRRGWRFLAPVQEIEDDPGLVGRRAELGALHAALGDGRAVVIHGPAGVGKSRLARAVLGAPLRAPASGSPGLPAAVEVSLRDARTADDVVDAVTAALGLPGGVRPDPAAIGRALAHRPGAALLLDDCEGVAAVLPALLPPWSGARVLLTSRARVEGCATVELAPLPEADAVALFTRCYAETFPRSRPPEPAAVLALVRGLDALPLAIELAVARLRALPLPELLDRLARSQRVLAGADGGARRSIDASLALLSPADQRLLAVLSVFPGTFAAPDVEGLGLVPAEGVIDGLCRLVDASLVTGEPGAFRLLAAVREIAAERRQTGDLDAWARWVAAGVEPELPGLWRWDAGSLVRLAARARELASAGRALSPAVPAPGVALSPDPTSSDPTFPEPASPDPTRETLAMALAGAVRYTGPWSVAREALERVASPGPACRALLAEYRIRTGDIPGALALLDALRSDPPEASPASPTSPTSPASSAPRAFATFLAARLATAMGDPSRGLALALDALAIAADNPAIAALALEQAGLSALRAGDPEAARAHLAAASARCATPELALLHGVVTQNHAATLGILGDHPAALAELRAAERALAALPFPHLLAAARANVGEALANLGHTDEAAPLLRAALDLGASIGDAVVERHTVGLLGLCALADGRAEEAERWLRRGVTLDGPPGERAQAWRRLALFEWDQRRDAVAQELLERAAREATPEGESAKILAGRLGGRIPSPGEPLPGIGPLEQRLVARLLARPD